ncbi:MAG: LacI family DNA-binding transcriptional regulator [Nocardioidaceae bacterium]
MATSNDVARHVGLSQATVSRALRGDASVTPKTRERVLAAARELGYVPHSAARTLVTRRSRAVGVVVADLSSPIYPVIVDSLQRRLDERGYRMILIRDPDRPGLENATDVLTSATVDGLIFASARDNSAAVRLATERGAPVVLLSRDDPSVTTDVVLSDDRAAGELVVAHLVEWGHERIGVLSTQRDRSNGRDREDGVREALCRRGMQVREEWIRRTSFDHAEAVRAAYEILQAPEAPTAIFCVADSFAFAVLDAAHQLGLGVPEDLSVVGFDDSEPSRWSFVSLTTVHQPIREMSREAVDRLVSRVETTGAHQPTRRVFPVTLRERATVARPAR